ncbi:MAG: DUF89 family protein [Spirochaetia bacterium]|nr:DUF89 family protein [Spirochaetia bacterium]
MSIKIDSTADSGISPICQICLINQVYSVADFSRLTPIQTDKVLQKVRIELEKPGETPVLPQHIARLIENTVNTEMGRPHDYDLYAELKEFSNRVSLSYAEIFQKKIDTSEKPLETGMQIAAASNIIDFGAKNHNSIDLNDELHSFDAVSFAHYDIEPLRKRLQLAETLLYICDNCGEIVFDKLFIQELKKEYPGVQIVAAVREKPILNDATLNDASFVGLNSVVSVVSSGSIYPGTILSDTNEKFQQLFTEADIIIAKGQGNFETLLPVADERLFFLLRIKCSFMAELSGVSEGDLVLMQGAAKTPFCSQNFGGNLHE